MSHPPFTVRRNQLLDWTRGDTPSRYLGFVVAGGARAVGSLHHGQQPPSDPHDPGNWGGMLVQQDKLDPGNQKSIL